MPAQVFCKLLRNQQGVNDQSGKPDTNESGMQTFMYSLPPHCRCPHVVHVALIFVFFVFITKWENKQMTCFFFETSQVVIRPLVCGSKENRFQHFIEHLSLIMAPILVKQQREDVLWILNGAEKDSNQSSHIYPQLQRDQKEN